MQYHERFGGVASSVTEAQPVMAMKSVPFCLTCVVADDVLECFVSKGRNRYDSMNWYLPFVIWKFSGDEKINILLLIFLRF